MQDNLSFLCKTMQLDFIRQEFLILQKLVWVVGVLYTHNLRFPLSIPLTKTNVKPTQPRPTNSCSSIILIPHYHQRRVSISLFIRIYFSCVLVSKICTKMSKAYTAWHAILLKVLNKPNLHLSTRTTKGSFTPARKEGLFVQVEVQDKLSSIEKLGKCFALFSVIPPSSRLLCIFSSVS